MISLSPVGTIHNEINDPTFPLRDYKKTVSEIRLQPLFQTESLMRLEEFSHLQVVFYFHKSPKSETVFATATPSENEWSLPEAGIFALRISKRPNNLGLSIVKILEIDAENLTIKVEGLDAMHGTPVVDIKPVVSDYLPEGGAIREPSWAQDKWEYYQQ